MKTFDRDLYFSQTECCKLYKISIKKFKKLIEDNKINVIQREITLHTSPEGLPYQVLTIYILKSDWINLIKNNTDVS